MDHASRMPTMTDGIAQHHAAAVGWSAHAKSRPPTRPTTVRASRANGRAAAIESHQAVIVTGQIATAGATTSIRPAGPRTTTSAATGAAPPERTTYEWWISTSPAESVAPTEQ